MPYEIERKFLVKGDFRTQAYAKSRIIQGYISSAHGRTVRVRIRDERGYLTIKGPSDIGGLVRFEWEKEIPLSEALQLLKICEPGIIDKTRYLVKSGQHIFEVDEFYGDNQGLVMAEVELGAPDEPFEKPDFIGEEVTGDRRYYNSQLRQHPFKEWGCKLKNDGETVRIHTTTTSHLFIGDSFFLTDRLVITQIESQAWQREYVVWYRPYVYFHRYSGISSLYPRPCRI